MRIWILLLTLGGLQAQPARKLLVLSVDGLDQRYLRDADRMGLKIPHLRRMMREGTWAEGVIGVAPTVTWPSHTTLITGVRPEEHGILSNRQPRDAGGDYYWSVKNLKVKTLWHAAGGAGKKTAAITWPVTVDAAIDYNLPEFFRKRNGGAMDLAGIEEKATPELVAAITKRYPAFPHEWVDDRSRALATMAMVELYQPDLLLVHFVDLDSEQHQQGPFSRDAFGILEYTDELIGQILRVLPRNYVVAVVSDHGFERVDRAVHVAALLERDGVDGLILPLGGVLGVPGEATANHLRAKVGVAEYGLLREIPKAEVERFSPRLARMAAVFEPLANTQFQAAALPRERGDHGFWPLRADYRSVYLTWGMGVKPGRLPEIDMLSICGRLAGVLGLNVCQP